MFAKLTDILSGKNWHVSDLYEQTTRMVAPGLPNDPQVTTMFFVLQRGVDRVIYANGGTPILQLDVKRLTPHAIIKLMDLYSGFMRRSMQLVELDNFELIDHLARQIFPHTAATSLALFEEESALMKARPMEWFRFGGSVWAEIGKAYLIGYIDVCDQEMRVNTPQFEHFLQHGHSLIWSDIEVILRGDPMGVSS